MTTLDSEAIIAEIENSLLTLASQEDAMFVMKARSILLTNLDRGRMQKFIEDDIKNVQAYVQKVVSGYKEFCQPIKRLQEDHSPEVWTDLLKKMQLWAFNYLIRKGYRADSTTQEIAEECVNDAAIQLLNAYFPFDTHFDAWAHVIVLNTCRKYFRREQKLSNVQDSQLVDLETVENYLKVPAHSEREWLEHIRNILFVALAQLSPARREVIELTYLEALPPNEIAEKMGKSIGAIYSLRFYALEDLRKILEKNGNNLNE